MQRLHPDSLHRLVATMARPTYDRTALQPGIVHLGVGAFQRAHLAAVTEAALHASGDLRWGIAGVSLRSPDTHDALAPQQGLYTLSLRDADPTGQPREALQVLGCLLDVQVAPQQPAAVIERLAAPATRIVSLTVTEKGYCHDPATGHLQATHPDLTHDAAHPEAPRGTLGFLLAGLRRRHAQGLAPVTVMSLDNLPSNGHLLQGLVLELAGQESAALARWVRDECTFPCSMVDRIVPRTTDADRARIDAALGLQDAWPVVAEPFLEWVVEDRFAAGRPAWEHGGARLVADARPYETLKLRMVNGTHSALAYLGAMAGMDTVDRAVADPALQRYLARMMESEIAPTLQVAGTDLADYQQRLLQRFANPALAHRTAQIAMDGSQKLPQRLLGTVRDRLARGQSIERLALAVAAWLHYLKGSDELGRSHTIQDPMAEALATLYARAAQAAAAAPAGQADAARAQVFAGFAPVFGTDLGQQSAFVGAVGRHLHSLRERGVRATLEALA